MFCMYRRPDFAPDGSFLVAPTGIYRMPAAASLGGANASNATEQPGTAASTKAQQSFCCHVFARNQLTFPAVSLAGLEEPAISVRFSPVLYNWMASNSPPLLNGKFRFVFAVTTSCSILIYDTQHTNPIVRITGRHFSNINDSAWSTDGRVLCCCSSDGYVTILRFETGALGTPVDPALVPEEVKLSHRCQYGYSGPTEAETAAPAEPGPSEPEPKDAEKASSSDVPAPVVDISSPRSGEAGSADGGVTASAVAGTASEKKRRRINPTPLGASESSAILTKTAIANDAFSLPAPSSGNAPGDAEPSSSSTSSPLDAVVPPTSDGSAKDGPSNAPQNDVANAKKAKKRIAPILVS